MRTDFLLIMFRALSRAMLRGGIALAFLTSLPAAAQVYAEYTLIFSPAIPMPGDNVTVFIRGTDPVNGFVFCPERAQIITAVQIAGDQIVLDLLPFGIPGGLIQPYCDGNTVSLGSLPAGTYTVTARPVFPSGTPGPVFASSLLTVGALPVPTLSASALITYASFLLLAGLFCLLAGNGRNL